MLSPTDIPQTLKIIIKTTREPHRHCKCFFLVYWSPTEHHRHCKCFFLVHMESHRTPQTLQMFLFRILSPTDIEKLLLRLPQNPTDIANDSFQYIESHRHPTDIEKLLLRLPQNPTDIANISFYYIGVPQNPTDIVNLSFQYIWSPTDIPKPQK